MKVRLILAVLLIGFISSCDKIENPITNTSSESFMPLQIGNYWRINDQNYTEIQDTVRINGDLYYKIFSLVGGDVGSEQYYRINANQDLIESSLRYPDYKFTKAKFNAKIGDSFQALGDQSYNDYKITVTEKTDTKMTFSYDMIYHPNLKGHPHTITFIKGFGWDGAWKIIRINGRGYPR
ncbi:MAG: hypothetical protein ACYCZO_02110 [Daejeonella sp.]